MTEPSEFEEFLARRERRRQMAVRIIDDLIALTLAAIAALVLKMIFL